MNYRLIAARALTASLIITAFILWFVSIWAGDERAGWSVIPCVFAAAISSLLLLGEGTKDD